MKVTASQQIVSDIRARIEGGQLRPGDPVPSTRQITSGWGVAMATASKALSQLKSEGLVRVLPGIGTVVASEGGDLGPGRMPDLSEEKIVDTAIALVDAHGMTALSMRRIAAHLRVAPMSLYRYVAGKDRLFQLMLDRAFGRYMTMPDDMPGGWRPRIELGAQVMWNAFVAHPWMPRAGSLVSPPLNQHTGRHFEWMLRSFDGCGLELEERFHAATTIVSFVRGAAVDLYGFAEMSEEHARWRAEQESVFAEFERRGQFPLFCRGFRSGANFDVSLLMDFGLARLLDGMEVWIASKGASPAKHS